MEGITNAITAGYPIESNLVFLLTKSYCPYSRASKVLFRQLGIPFKAIDVDVVADGEALHEAARRLTVQETVPYVFIRGDFSGGYTDLVRTLQSGELQTKLNKQ